MPAFIQQYPHLFTPKTIRGIQLKNRILSAPMGIWGLCPEDGLSSYTLSFFAERAKGGAATVTFGDTQVNVGEPEQDRMGCVLPLRVPPTPRALLSEFASVCHQHGALASIELVHGGQFVLTPPGQCAYGATDHTGPFGEVKAMTREKIKEVQRQFAECAVSVQRAGFQMVTIHGGHGRLFNQFQDRGNNRSDEYGGCLENRMRFTLETLTQLRQAVGDRFIIELRVSSRDPELEPEEFEELVTLLNRLEGTVDIINVSVDHPPVEPFFSETDLSMQPSFLDPPAPNVCRAAALKQRIRIPVAAVGAIITPEIAENILASGKADFVALARPLLADPEWPNKARQGRGAEINVCIGCMKCLNHMHDTHVIRCAINPRAGIEAVTPRRSPSPVSKHLVVAGGGIAGMTAAITAARRGHRVTLLEQKQHLGGILHYITKDPLKYRLKGMLDQTIKLLEQENVSVLLGVAASAEYIQAMEPDAVFLATGASPMIPDIPGVEQPFVLDTLTAYAQKDQLGKRIVIVGGNQSGCELAISLLRTGRKVAVLEAGASLHSASNNARLDFLLRDADLHTNTVCTQIGIGEVHYCCSGSYDSIPADNVILAVGTKSTRNLADDLRFLAPEYTEIGDCLTTGDIMNAIHSAYFAALDL